MTRNKIRKNRFIKDPRRYIKWEKTRAYKHYISLPQWRKDELRREFLAELESYKSNSA